MIDSAKPGANEDTARRTGKGRISRFHLLTDVEVEHLPAPEWLIENIIPVGTLGLLYGPPGVGKSFIALDWACSVASGRKWQRHKVQQGSVVYVAAEGALGLRQRLRAWKSAFGLSQIDDARFLGQSVQLLKKLDVRSFIRDVEAQLGAWPNFILIDTLARCFVGGEENSATDMGEFIAAANNLQRDGKATVLLIHHSVRNGGHERGSSALPGAVETIVALSKRKNVITLECEKQKDAEEFDPIRMNLVKHLDSCIIEQSGLKPSPKSLTDNQRHCLCSLVGIEGDGATCGVWARASGLTPSSFYRRRGELAEDHYVERDGNHYRLTDKGRKALTPTSKELS